jgi:hypothetical protein
MHTDLSDFLTHLASTVAMALIPVALIAVLSMPASLHHHMGAATALAHVQPTHMT